MQRQHALTSRDLALLRYLVRHGVCTPDQISVAAPDGRPFFTSVWACYRRLRILEGMGFIERHKVLVGQPAVLLATRIGAQLADADLSPAKLHFPTVAHSLSVVDLSEHLLKEHRGARWVTERELRRDALRQRGQDGGAGWSRLIHTPDGLLVLHPPRGGAERRVAVELDLTPKQPDRYDRILSAFATAPGVDQVWWFTSTAALRDRVDAAIRRNGMASLAECHVWTGVRGVVPAGRAMH